MQGGEAPIAGHPKTMESHVLDMGAKMMQSMKPIKEIQQHVCTFAIYGHDMNRQIETHHYVSRLNQDVLQCAVYDTDESNARLIGTYGMRFPFPLVPTFNLHHKIINCSVPCELTNLEGATVNGTGVEYVVSDKVFETLPPEEQKLWHSHAYEIKAGYWINPGVPEMLQKPELQNLAKTYGKFWCTWQADRGDRLPMGPPSLMMSPQGVNLGMVKPELLKKRDDKYNVSSGELRQARMEIPEPEWINPRADHWKTTGKGFAIDVNQTQMKLRAPFP